MSPCQSAHWYSLDNPPKTIASGPRQNGSLVLILHLCQASVHGNPKPGLGFPTTSPPPGKIFVLRNWTTVPRESSLYERLPGVCQDHKKTTRGSILLPPQDTPTIGPKILVAAAGSLNSTATEESSLCRSTEVGPRSQAPHLQEPTALCWASTA